jgi:hypothetical protein
MCLPRLEYEMGLGWQGSDTTSTHVRLYSPALRDVGELKDRG